MFEREEILAGRGVDAVQKWKDAISDPTVSKRWHKGTSKYLLHKFRGMRNETGDESKQSVGYKRARAISDSVDAEDVEKLRSQLVKDQQRADKRKRVSDSAHAIASPRHQKLIQDLSAIRILCLCWRGRVWWLTF